MPNPWIKAAILASILILPVQAMAQAGNRNAYASDRITVASHDGHNRGSHYDRRDQRRDYRYDHQNHKRDKPHKLRKHKKKSAKAYNKGYRHGVRDSRRPYRHHYRSRDRHYAGYAHGYRPRRVAPHYHQGPWGWYPCSVFHR